MKSYITRKKSFGANSNSYLPDMEKNKVNKQRMWLQSKGIKHLIGIRLRQAREKKGFNQMELAFLIDADQQYISKVESGKVNISVINLYKITFYLDLHINLMEK